MYRAKERGRNAVQSFEPGLADAAKRRAVLSRRQREAVEQKRFELHYQPQIDLPAGRVSGGEAPIRLHDEYLARSAPRHSFRLPKKTA
jgi:sensor c-di-GMP phosphodiesterase-like protein